jgi:hypothetical protein
MHGKLSLQRPRSISERAAWVAAVSALALTLALGGCRAGAHTGNSQSTIQQGQSGASGATGGSSNSPSLQQLESVDSQNQSDIQQLDSAQNAAGVNYSSQENQTQP